MRPNITSLSEGVCLAVLCIIMFHRLSEGKAAAIRAYQQTQAAFEDTSAYVEIKDELLVRRSLTTLVTQLLHVVFVCIQSELEAVCHQRRDDNYQAYIKEVSGMEYDS